MAKKILTEVETSFHIFFRGNPFRGKAEVLSTQTGITDMDQAIEHFNEQIPNAEITKVVEYKRGPSVAEKWLRISERVLKVDTEEEEGPAAEGESAE